jgi:hypothetical protein
MKWLCSSLYRVIMSEPAGIGASVVPTYLDNPEFWRTRAAEARGQAEQMRDRDAKQALLKFANVYERRAKRAEAHKNGRKSST